MVSKARACGNFTQSRFQTHGAGKQGDIDMKKAGPVAGYVHRPPLPFKLKARPCVRDQLESIKMRGQGVGGWGQWVGGQHYQKRGNQQRCGWLHGNGKKNRTKSELPHFLSHPSHQFLFPLPSFSAWHANGIGSPLPMEKTITVRHTCKLQTKAWVKTPLLKWTLSPRWD